MPRPFPTAAVYPGTYHKLFCCCDGPRTHNGQVNGVDILMRLLVLLDDYDASLEDKLLATLARRRLLN